MVNASRTFMAFAGGCDFEEGDRQDPGPRRHGQRVSFNRTLLLSLALLCFHRWALPLLCGFCVSHCPPELTGSSAVLVFVASDLPRSYPLGPLIA